MAQQLVAWLSHPGGRQAQPDFHNPTEAAPHIDVQTEGWQWSYLLDEPILHSARGRPYYRNRKSGKFMCHTVHRNALRPYEASLQLHNCKSRGGPAHRTPLQLLQAGVRVAQSTAKVTA